MKALRCLLLIYAMAMSSVGNAAGVCVAKTIKNAKGADFSLMLIVTNADAVDLLLLGFTSEPCGTFSQHIAEYKAAMCKTAAFGNEAVQNRFTNILGLTPARLCASASALLG